MTRDEAEMLAIGAVGFEFSEDARRHLAILVALGMLKLDKPKNANVELYDILQRHAPKSTSVILNALAISGIETVYKAGTMPRPGTCSDRR